MALLWATRARLTQHTQRRGTVLRTPALGATRAATAAATKHSRAEGGAKPLQSFDHSVSFEDIRGAFERDGAVVVRGMLDQVDVEALRRETAQSFESAMPGTKAAALSVPRVLLVFAAASGPHGYSRARTTRPHGTRRLLLEFAH